MPPRDLNLLVHLFTLHICRRNFEPPGTLALNDEQPGDVVLYGRPIAGQSCLFTVRVKANFDLAKRLPAI